MSLINAKWFDNFFIQETPSGAINGVNTSFSITYNPIFDSAHLLFLNGVLLTNNVHYTITNNNITMIEAPALGQDLLSVYIRGL